MPALIFWGIFAYVIFQVEYPKSLTQASLWQILAFFLPLFLALSFSLDLFFKNLFSSITVSAGLILLLILKALDILNLVTAGLTLLAVYLFYTYFQNMRKNSKLKPLRKLK